MRPKSVVGLFAILAALAILAIANRSSFERDTYVVCLGTISDSPVVSDAEQTLCACMARRAVEAVFWKAWLPQSMITLTDEDNTRMVEAQKTCRATSDT